MVIEVKYIADDGRVFDNEDECVIYEYKKNFTHLNDIYVYNDEGVRLWPFAWDGAEYIDDAFYNASSRVIIYNEEALEEFRKLADDSGWLNYIWYIDKCGDWVYNEEEELFELL